MASQLFRRPSLAPKLDRSQSEKTAKTPQRRVTLAGLETTEHPSKRGLDTHALEDKEDVLMGGALSTDDLFELLDMEMESLAEKCKSPEGITKGDLRPLIKAIGDLRAVNLGQDDRVKRAVEFQMRCTSQLVAQQEIKSALQTRSVADVQKCLEKVKIYNLQKLNLAKRLETEWVAIQKELSKETKAEIERVAAENKRLQKELGEKATSASPTVGKESSGRRKSMVPSLSAMSLFGKKEPQPDDLALEDTYASMSVKDLRALCMENGIDPTNVLEKSELVRLVSAALATKPLRPKPEVPAPKTKPYETQSMPGGSALGMMGIVDELAEKNRAAALEKLEQEKNARSQYDLLIEAMRRVKLAMDAPGANPGSIIGAAGNGMDMVTGDMNAVHLFLGDYHGVVKPSASGADSNRTTIVIGEVDDNKSDPKEIRVMTDSARLKELEEENAKLKERLEALEKAKPEARLGGSAASSPRASPRAMDSGSSSNNSNSNNMGPRRSSLGTPSVYAGAAVAALMRERADTAANEAAAAAASEANGEQGEGDVNVGEGSSTSAPAPASGVSSSAASAEGVALREDPRFALYFKMLNVGLPKDAVRHKMEQDMKDPAILDLDPSLPLPANFAPTSAPVPAGPPLREDIRFVPYFKMIAVGVPRFAVEQKMRSKGLDPAVLDMDLDAPAPAQVGSGEEVKDGGLKRPVRKVPDEQWKKLHWQSILAPVPSKSVWTKAQDFDLLDDDRKELQLLFALKLAAKMEAEKTAAQADEAAALVKKVQILETQRANNIAIVLSRLQMSAKDVRRMVCTLHLSDQFSADDVRAVLAFVPTVEEVEKLKTFSGDRERLGVGERHMLAILDIPRFKQRINCFLFKLKFGDVCSDVEFDIEALEKGCQDILTSDKLPKLFGMVLKIGNLMNSQGGALTPDDGFRPAVGFRINALGKLRTAKSYSSGNMTALHYLVRLAQERQRQVLNFMVAETDFIRGAANVSLSQTKGHIRSLALGIKELDNERMVYRSMRDDASASFAHEDSNFLIALESFYKRAMENLSALQTRFDAVEKQFAEVLLYLGEDPETTPEALFKSLANFFDDVVLAINENELEKAKSAKKSRDKKARTKKLTAEDSMFDDEEENEEEAEDRGASPSTGTIAGKAPRKRSALAQTSGNEEEDDRAAAAAPDDEDIL